MRTFFEIATSLLMVAGAVWAWWMLRPPTSRRPSEADEKAEWTPPTE